MYTQETIKPYNENEEKASQVEQMFDNIASTYDKLNHRLSWNIDKWWRKNAISILSKYHPLSILDVATGTGDFAIQEAKTLKPERIVGVDISEGMMAIGAQKVKSLGLDNVIEFQREDCLSMSFADNSFDAITAAFGIRNFQQLERGLAEMLRVLKPEGHVCIIELTSPVRFPMKQLFWLYSHFILPVYGRIISKDSSAYTYLTKTIEVFPQGEEMMEIFKRLGYKDVMFKRLTFGICTMYFASK